MGKLYRIPDAMKAGVHRLAAVEREQGSTPLVVRTPRGTIEAPGVV